MWITFTVKRKNKFGPYWYLSQKIAYDSSVADSAEEYEEAVGAFQSAFEAVIDRHADDIVSVIENECEEEEVED